MAHYAFLNEQNIVTEVIFGKNENEDGVDWESHYGAYRNQKCKRTSYNTRGGIHELGGVPFRKNYAGIGFIYNQERDAFIPPTPYPSWLLNEDTCLWDAPVAMPADAGTGKPPKHYLWNEEAGNWVNQVK